MVVVHLRDDQLLAQWIPREHAPARTLNQRCGRGQLCLEGIEGSEVVLDRRGKFTVGAIATVWREVLPEDRVQYVAAQVECEGLFQTNNSTKRALVTRFS